MDSVLSWAILCASSIYALILFVVKANAELESRKEVK